MNSIEQNLLQEYLALEQYVFVQKSAGKIPFIVEKDQLDIQLLGDCRAKCGFCSVIESRDWGEVCDNHFLKYLNLYLPLILPNSNIDRVIITGGEPTQYMNRLLATIKELQQCKWKVCSAITNGSRLTDLHKGKPIPELLAEAGLRQIAWSIHSANSEINNKILGLKNVDIAKGVEMLIKNGISMRLNSVAQKEGVNNLGSLVDLLEMANKNQFKDVYIRDLFDPIESAMSIKGHESHADLERNPQQFTRNNRIDTFKLISEVQNDNRFEEVVQKEFESRDKSEFNFKYLPTGMEFWISTLAIGNESDPKFAQQNQLPYLIYAQNGMMYRNYIDEETLSKTIRFGST
jgi:molybdenum cofactor biosynthesis enzyme MoaA